MDTVRRNRRVPSAAPQFAICNSRSTRRRGFTLVELLVVITIIGILAALITVAAVGALKAMRRNVIKVEINEIANGFDEYRNKANAYPPNSQTDGSGATNPLDEPSVLNDMKRHIQQLASRRQETDDLAKVLTGQVAVDTTSYPRVLAGGISAPEAVVFWLGGFSSDPKYPISGEGGPSYPITSFGDPANRSLDPIESRKWVYPFVVSRLGPRGSDGYFDETNGRYIEYTDPKGQKRRINFWQYYPSHSEQPFVYFDTSRHPVGTVVSSTLRGTYDPPAATATVGSADLNSVYAFKKALETAAQPTAPQIQFINPAKFQVFHCGIDGAWDTASFGRMAPKTTTGPNPPAGANDPSKYLLFPNGPFIGDVSDTEVNFATETTIEDAAK